MWLPVDSPLLFICDENKSWERPPRMSCPVGGAAEAFSRFDGRDVTIAQDLGTTELTSLPLPPARVRSTYRGDHPLTIVPVGSGYDIVFSIWPHNLLRSWFEFFAALLSTVLRQVRITKRKHLPLHIY
ncbi:hypothetical protein ACROYT_G023263 [Oculina patagonica]